MLHDQTIDAFPVAISAKRANAAPLERHTAPSQSRSMTTVRPIMGIVSVAFLVIGFALPVLPLHVHQDLGLSTFVVGLVTGSQFAAYTRRTHSSVIFGCDRASRLATEALLQSAPWWHLGRWLN